jgi:ATP-dependent DNA ligase
MTSRASGEPGQGAQPLFVKGEDVRALPLKDRKRLLAKVVRRYRLQNSDPVLGEGERRHSRPCAISTWKGLVVKRLGDAYARE